MRTLDLSSSLSHLFHMRFPSKLSIDCEANSQVWMESTCTCLLVSWFKCSLLFVSNILQCNIKLTLYMMYSTHTFPLHWAGLDISTHTLTQSSVLRVGWAQIINHWPIRWVWFSLPRNYLNCKINTVFLTFHFREKIPKHKLTIIYFTKFILRTIY